MSESNENQVPKDLIMFSPRARKEITKSLDQQYLNVDYDIKIPDYENDPKYRVWGLKFYGLTNPVLSGILGGAFFGSAVNFLRKRNPLANIHLHIFSGLTVAASMFAATKYYENYTYKNEMIIWDYVKRHPEDFPEVFNEPKKFKHVLKSWTPSRV